MKKVSIIVPVYNGQDFINRCLNSLINQTYSNVEIIVINDGSTDNSLDLLKKYNDKIILINKENSGVSDSRNLGLEKASGDYIMFCDIDDWYEKVTVEKAVCEIGNYDLLKYRETRVFSDGSSIKRKENLAPMLYEKEEIDIVIRRLFDLSWATHIYCFIYKTEIIKKNNIRFNSKIRYAEDANFILQYLLKVKNIKVIDEYLYNYYENSNSVTNNYSSIFKNMENLQIFRSETLKTLGNKYKKELDQFLLNLILLYLEKPFDILKTKKEIKDYYKKICNSLNGLVNDLPSNNYSKKWKILIYLIKHNRYIFLYLYIKLYLKMR